MGLALRFDRIQAETQLSESKRKANEEINRMALSFNENQDPETYQKELKNSLSAIAKFKPKNKRAAYDFKIWLDDRIPRWTKGVAESQIVRQEDNWMTELFERKTTAELARDVGDFPEFLAAGVAEGMIDRSDAAKILAGTRITAQYGRGIVSLEADPVAFLEKIDDKDYLPRLDAQAKSMLKRRARTQMGIVIAQQRELKEQVTNEEQGRLMQLARKGQLTGDIIRTSKLDEFGTGSKSTFYGILDKLSDAALEEKEAPFKESVPEVEAKILEQIRDARSDITPKDISELVGKGLSIDDADHMISRLDVYKGFWFGRADRFLKDQLGWNDTYTKFMHPEGAISYHAAMNQLFTDIEEKKLRDKDIYERGIETGIPYVVDYWENVLSLEKPQIERMTKMLRGKPSPKPTKPAEKKKQSDILDPEGIWK